MIRLYLWRFQDSIQSLWLMSCGDPNGNCKKILFHCEKESTVSIVNKGRSKYLEIMKLMWQFTLCACVNNCQCSAKHVSGRKTNISDPLSRLQIGKIRILALHAEQLPNKLTSVYEVMGNYTGQYNICGLMLLLIGHYLCIISFFLILNYFYCWITLIIVHIFYLL
jgi:hypothetical protein